MRFEVPQRVSPSNHFVILEVWKDQAALDAHTAAAPRQAVQRQADRRSDRAGR